MGESLSHKFHFKVLFTLPSKFLVRVQNAHKKCLRAGADLKGNHGDLAPKPIYLVKITIKIERLRKSKFRRWVNGEKSVKSVI